MKIKRLNSRYGTITKEFETVKDILIKNKYKVDLLKLKNKEIIYYYLANRYFNKNIMLCIIEYNEEYDDYYSLYICEFSSNEKNILSKARENIKKAIQYD